MLSPRRWWVIGIAAVLIAAGAIGSVVLYRWQMPNVRARLVTILSEELGARVELADLQVQLGWGVEVIGRGLVLHHKAADAALPPLVRIERFSIVVPLLAILRSPIHVRSVSLERLEIFLPKRGRAAGGGPDRKPALNGRGAVVIDRLRSQNATLAIQSSKPDRPPRTFEIHDLTLVDAAFDRPIRFEALLTNPKPLGRIQASGQFGPWVADDPSQSRAVGDYHFAKADLGTIKGIGGTLESRGSFTGPLDQIGVKGSTTTPDFSLDIGGQPLPLATTFVALVDGTNGDTILHDVVATLGNTPIRAKGGVLHTPGRRGRTVVLHATIDKGQLPDVLRLALDNPTPPMNGQLTLRALINLPPGEPKVVDRLELSGEFGVDALTFASNMVQSKIDEFSRRGRGRPTDTSIQQVPSAMRGAFQLKDGVLRFTGLSFVVQGALVRLHGSYRLRGGALDFRGSVRLQARASQTMTGWKSWLARPFDPILAKDGAGTVLPIAISGTAKQPKFGVEMKKIF